MTDDLDWGEAQLRKHIPGYVPLGFAPPFGAYGQLDTNDPAIPALFGAALRERFGLVFVQADPHPAVPGEQDVTRLQLDRTTTGGAAARLAEARLIQARPAADDYRGRCVRWCTSSSASCSGRC